MTTAGQPPLQLDVRLGPTTVSASAALGSLDPNAGGLRLVATTTPAATIGDRVGSARRVARTVAVLPTPDPAALLDLATVVLPAVISHRLLSAFRQLVSTAAAPALDAALDAVGLLTPADPLGFRAVVVPVGLVQDPGGWLRHGVASWRTNAATSGVALLDALAPLVAPGSSLTGSWPIADGVAMTYAVEAGNRIRAVLAAALDVGGGAGTTVSSHVAAGLQIGPDALPQPTVEVSVDVDGRGLRLVVSSRHRPAGAAQSSSAARRTAADLPGRSWARCGAGRCRRDGVAGRAQRARRASHRRGNVGAEGRRPSGLRVRRRTRSARWHGLHRHPVDSVRCRPGGRTHRAAPSTDHERCGRAGSGARPGRDHRRGHARHQHRDTRFRVRSHGGDRAGRQRRDAGDRTSGRRRRRGSRAVRAGPAAAVHCRRRSRRPARPSRAGPRPVRCCGRCWWCEPGARSQPAAWSGSGSPSTTPRRRVGRGPLEPGRQPADARSRFTARTAGETLGTETEAAQWLLALALSLAGGVVVDAPRGCSPATARRRLCRAWCSPTARASTQIDPGLAHRLSRPGRAARPAEAAAVERRRDPGPVDHLRGPCSPSASPACGTTTKQLGVSLSLAAGQRFTIAERDTRVELEVDASWVTPAVPAGLSIFVLSGTSADTLVISPAVSVAGLGLRFTNMSGPLLSLGAVSLDGIAVHLYGEAETAGAGSGVNFELAGLAFAPGGGGGSNAVANSIMNDAGRGGPSSRPAFSPSMAVQKHPGLRPCGLAARGTSSRAVVDRHPAPARPALPRTGRVRHGGDRRTVSRISLLFDGRVSIFGLTAAVDQLSISWTGGDRS